MALRFEVDFPPPFRTGMSTVHRENHMSTPPTSASIQTVAVELGTAPIHLEVSDWAPQTDAAVLARQRESVVLATVVAATDGEDRGFVPLTVDYRERLSAVGRVPGGYLRRELRASDREVRIARVIDRAIRPRLDPSHRGEISVAITVYSADPATDLTALALTAAAAACSRASLAFAGPIVGVRLVIDEAGSASVLDRWDQLHQANHEWLLAWSGDGVVMLEGGGAELAPEAATKALASVIPMLDASLAALQPFTGAQALIPTRLPEPPAGAVLEHLDAAFAAGTKAERHALWAKAKEAAGDPADFDAMVAADTRRRIAAGGRFGGRGHAEVRAVSAEVGLFPSGHGSALFRRGLTHALGTATLGGSEEVLEHDTLFGKKRERVMLHYNFPPSAVGEARPHRGPGRRELGHGRLAWRGLRAVLPRDKELSWSVRVTSDVLSSDGSSSMATVSAGCLALMDAGAPVARHVAGVSVGLVRAHGNEHILVDISADEDHYGDMDFKLAASDVGLTAIQLDVVSAGLSLELFTRTLAAAATGAASVRQTQAQVLAERRPELSPNAPQVIEMTIPRSMVGTVIGQGGKAIHDLQSRTKTKIDIRDNGVVRILGKRAEDVRRARAMIEAKTFDLKINTTYLATVSRKKDYGAFVRIGAHEALVHVSELETRLADVGEGQKLRVMVLGADKQGRVQLSERAGRATADEAVIDPDAIGA